MTSTVILPAPSTAFDPKISSVTVKVPALTVNDAVPKSPVNVTLLSDVACTLLAVIVDRSAFAIASRFKTSTLPAPLMVLPFSFVTSALIVPLATVTVASLRSPVNVPVPSHVAVFVPEIVARFASNVPSRFVIATVPLLAILFALTILASAVKVVPLFTVNATDPRFPVKVTSVFDVAFAVPLIADKSASAFVSKFVTSTVPLLLTVLPSILSIATVKVLPLSTAISEFAKSPVNVELPVNSMVSVPLKARLLKSWLELLLTSTVILPAPFTDLEPKIASVIVNVPAVTSTLAIVPKLPAVKSVV